MSFEGVKDMSELLEERFGRTGRVMANMMVACLWAGGIAVPSTIIIGGIGAVLRFVFGMDVTPDQSGEVLEVLQSVVVLFFTMCAVLIPAAITYAIGRWLLAKVGIGTGN